MTGNIKKVGQRTVVFNNSPSILETASVVGPKEGEGPLADTFDEIIKDSYYGEKNWERAERKMLEQSVNVLLEKSNLKSDDIDFMLAGDLLNQTVSSNFTAGTFGIPYFGIFGACSTMYEALALGSMLLDGGFGEKIVAATSSHYSTLERQFRFPTEQAVQRAATAQWTVTGAGAFLLGNTGGAPYITHATIGKVVDKGIKNPNDMGSVMAPAAVDTIVTHLQDTGRTEQDYDLIITGDLGFVGRSIVVDLGNQQGYNFSSVLSDCGMLIFDTSQDAHAGGSGCACSAVVTAGYLLDCLRNGKYKRILGVGTGALLSATTVQQGESIPAIAHAAVIEAAD